MIFNFWLNFCLIALENIIKNILKIALKIAQNYHKKSTKNSTKKHKYQQPRNGNTQIENFLKKYKNFSLVTPDDDIKKYGKLLNNSMLLITPKQNYFTKNLVGIIDGFFIAILKKEYE